jgi:hypothetical protein
MFTPRFPLRLLWPAIASIANSRMPCDFRFALFRYPANAAGGGPNWQLHPAGSATKMLEALDKQGVSFDPVEES